MSDNDIRFRLPSELKENFEILIIQKKYSLKSMSSVLRALIQMLVNDEIDINVLKQRIEKPRE